MERLELKHLTTYLPYEVKLKWLDIIITVQGVTENKHGTFIYGEDGKGTNHSFYNNGEYDVKLILRPLSDLFIYIEHNGNKFCPQTVLENTFGDITRLTDTMQVGSFVPYGIVKKLFEWHFDVFGLIEKGLAIDVNTL